jgi:hypothetical protein
MRGVKSVIPDYVVVGQEARSVQWHLDRTDQRYLPLDNSYNPFGNGSGVDIYVLDSGANFNHTDIKDRLIYPGRDMIDEATGSTRNGSDCYGHGTHVAGLAAGKKYGIAPGATIISIRVLDCNNFGPYVAVLSGIDYALDIIKIRKRKSVVSMSLLSVADESFDSSVKKLIEMGIPVVVAAGNYKMSACKFSPSRLSDVITVGATKQELDALYWFTSRPNSPGTNYGSCVDIFAPGQWIRSAGWKCDECESSRSGTSMATPLVSGMVALLLQKYPSYTPVQIKAKLLELSTKNMLNFSALPMDTDEEAKKTPNRLLYVPRVDEREDECPTRSATISPSTLTPTTVNPPRAITQAPLATVTTPPTTDVPPITTTPALPTETTLITNTPTPVPTKLEGTILEKQFRRFCHGRLLDSSSSLIYEDIPKESLQQYTDDLRKLGYSLTGLFAMKHGWNVESRFIMIFSKKKRVYTIPLFRHDYLSLRLALIRYGVRRYYPHTIVNSVEFDENGKVHVVYSAIVCNDRAFYGVQISRKISKPDVIWYMEQRNGSRLVNGFTLQHISSVSYPVFPIPSSFKSTRESIRFDYILMSKIHRRYRFVNYACKTLEEVRSILNAMHEQNYYLTSFDSHWISDKEMMYNLVFTNEPKEGCNCKLIMDMTRSNLQSNAKILSAQGWIPTLVGTYQNGSSLQYIAVWWK